MSHEEKTTEDSGSRTVINHNPLPDITHEEFVSLLGPLLVPENYELANTTSPPTTPALGSSANQSPAPFEWLHFEGRSVKTTLSNVVGIDGLARERKWRSHCVFSLDVCKVRQGVEAVSLLLWVNRTFSEYIVAYATCRCHILFVSSQEHIQCDDHV